MKFFKKHSESSFIELAERNSDLREELIDISIYKKELEKEDFLKAAFLRLPKAVLGKALQFLDSFDLANLGFSPLGERILLQYISKIELKTLIATGFAPLTLNKIEDHIELGVTVYEQNHPNLTRINTICLRAFWTITYIGLGIGFPAFLMYMFLFTEHPGLQSHKNNEPAPESFIMFFFWVLMWWMGILMGVCLTYANITSEREKEILNDEAFGIILSKDEIGIKAVCDYIGINNKTVAEFQAQVQELQITAPNFPAFFKPEQKQPLVVIEPQETLISSSC